MRQTVFMKIKEFNYAKIKAPGIDQRYLSPEQIDQVTASLSVLWQKKLLGHSVEQRPIYAWSWGRRPTKAIDVVSNARQ